MLMNSKKRDKYSKYTCGGMTSLVFCFVSNNNNGPTRDCKMRLALDFFLVLS